MRLTALRASIGPALSIGACPAQLVCRTSGCELEGWRDGGTTCTDSLQCRSGATCQNIGGVFSCAP